MFKEIIPDPDEKKILKVTNYSTSNIIVDTEFSFLVRYKADLPIRDNKPIDRIVQIVNKFIEEYETRNLNVGYNFFLLYNYLLENHRSVWRTNRLEVILKPEYKHYIEDLNNLLLLK